MVGKYSSSFCSVQLSEPPSSFSRNSFLQKMSHGLRGTAPPQSSPKDLCRGASLGRQTEPQLQDWPQMLPDPTRTAGLLRLLSRSQPRKPYLCTRMANLERCFQNTVEGYHSHQVVEPPWRIKSNVDQQNEDLGTQQERISSDYRSVLEIY